MESVLKTKIYVLWFYHNYLATKTGAPGKPIKG